MSGGSEKEISAVDEYCGNLGIAFQIQDDLLDVLGNEEILGKATGSDCANEKTTFITLYGVEKSKRAVDEYTKKACSAIDCFGENARQLKELAKLLIDRKF